MTATLLRSTQEIPITGIQAKVDSAIRGYGYCCDKLDFFTHNGIHCALPVIRKVGTRDIEPQHMWPMFVTAAINEVLRRYKFCQVA